jgi:hypothetical protein
VAVAVVAGTDFPRAVVINTAVPVAIDMATGQRGKAIPLIFRKPLAARVESSGGSSFRKKRAMPHVAGGLAVNQRERLLQKSSLDWRRTAMYVYPSPLAVHQMLFLLFI